MFERVGGIIMSIYNSLRRQRAYLLLQELHPELYETNGYQYFKKQAKNLYAGVEHSSYTRPVFNKSLNKTEYKRGKVANPTKFICEDMTRLSFGEKAVIKIENNSEVDNYFQEVFKRTKFINKLKDLTERSFYAIGGMASMPSLVNDELVYDWIDADLFIPTFYTQDSIIESKYAKIGKKNQTHYILIVKNTIENETLVITNELYIWNKSKEKFKKSKLELLFPELEESTTVEGVSNAIITYGRNAKANNIDFDTPEGLPFTANAEDLIQEYNMNVDNIFSEIKNGKLRIGVPESWTTEHVNKTGNYGRGLDITKDEILLLPSRTIDSDNAIEYNQGPYRTTEIMDMGQGLLNMIAVQIGIDAGYYSFNPESGGITATEVISKRSKTYTEKRNEEKNISMFVSELVMNSIRVLKAEGIAFTDLDETKLEIKFIADDSIITDDNKAREEARAEVEAGLRSDFNYMTTQRKLTDKEAQNEMDQITKEKQEKQSAFFNDGDNNEDDNEEDDDE